MQTNLFTKNLDSSEKFPFQAFAVILLSIAFSLAAIHFSPAPKFGFAPSFESIIARFSQNNNSQALALATSIPEELVFDEQATTPGDTVNENANETNLLLAPLGETPPENFARRELKIDSLLSRIAVLTESYAITSQPRFECDYSMAKLNSSLVLSANAKRKTRILVFGDSMIESDYIISALRNTLQRIFGDGGIGFVPANTCDGCKFHGLTVRRSGDWQTYDVFHDFCVDSLYGPSCTFIQAPAGATDLHLFYDKAPTFDNKLMPIDYFSIIYLERPDGGTVELIIDDTLRTDFTTKGSSMQVRRFSVKLARRSHTFIVHPKGDGVARIYGAEFLLGEQGVTVEGISIRGARLDNLDRNRDEHWQQSLELLSPDAVIVFFGANSSGYDTLPAWFKHSSKRTFYPILPHAW